MRRLLAIVLAGAGIALLHCAPASAHGPCGGCIQPRAAEPGQRITVDYPTYLAIWNPGKAVLTKGPKPNCYGCGLGLWRDRVSGTPSIRVFEHRPRVPEFTFAVPEVPPGKYLVALFDGSEGAGHYSWNFVTVRGDGGDQGSGGGSGFLIPGVIAVGLLLALGAWLGYRRTRQAAP